MFRIQILCFRPDSREPETLAFESFDNEFWRFALRARLPAPQGERCAEFLWLGSRLFAGTPSPAALAAAGHDPAWPCCPPPITAPAAQGLSALSALSAKVAPALEQNLPAGARAKAFVSFGQGNGKCLQTEIGQGELLAACAEKIEAGKTQWTFCAAVSQGLCLSSATSFGTSKFGIDAVACPAFADPGPALRMRQGDCAPAIELALRLGPHSASCRTFDDTDPSACESLHSLSRHLDPSAAFALYSSMDQAGALFPEEIQGPLRCPFARANMSSLAEHLALMAQSKDPDASAKGIALARSLFRAILQNPSKTPSELAKRAKALSQWLSKNSQNRKLLLPLAQSAAGLL